MSKFDPIWHELKPKAIRLREEGLTPQQTCNTLAWMIFGDNKKFNTVKGWYKRTFSDWPSEEQTASLNERGPRLSRMHYQQQQQAGYHPKTNPALLPPQDAQNYHQNYGAQQGSISSSFQQVFGFPHQAEYQNLQLQDATIHVSFQQDLDQHPDTGSFQHTSSAVSHSMGGQGSPENNLNTLAPQISTGQFASSYQQHTPRDRFENVSQSPAGIAEQPFQPDYTQYHQNSHSQHPQHTLLGRHPARRDSLLKSDDTFDHDDHQKSSSLEKNPAVYQLPLEPNFENQMGSCFLIPIDNNDGGMDPPVDSQQSTMQSAIAPNKFVLPSESQDFSAQPPNHQSISESSARSFAVSPTKNYQAYTSPSHQYPSGIVAVQNERSRTSTTPYRSSLVLSNPTPPPQYPLPPVPPPKFGVIHKGPNQPWRPMRMDGNSMVKINPNEFPPNHRRKRPRGKIANEARDSIALYPKQNSGGTRSIPAGSPASHVARASAARGPLVNRPVNSSNVSVHSSLRDSGYISNFDSAMVESIRSSLSSFALTDDPNLNTDYKEDGDGYVVVEVQAKWRVRKSYLEKRDSLVVVVDD